MDIQKNAKRILVSLDGSENALRGIDYLASVIGKGKGFFIRIITVDKEPSRDLFPDETSWQQAREQKYERAQTIVAEGMERLRMLGTTDADLDTKVVRCKGPGIAQAIIEEQSSDNFGTVIVGRRGVSKAEEFLFGSVSNKIVHYARDCTVWVIQ